ncbi:MAG: DUF3015 family protein [Campylobacterota bacterium]|nr:DUF3015 family protein [Campylobacterota bacterium]
MKKILLSAIAIATIGSMNLVAANMQTGCGLGGQVIKKPNTAVLFAIQATTNGTSGNQTFGITFGTVGCKKYKFVMNERAEEFVASNMDGLAKDISKGQGESLSTLAELLEIQDKTAFYAALQSNYNSIYTNAQVQMSDVIGGVSSSI